MLISSQAKVLVQERQSALLLAKGLEPEFRAFDAFALTWFW
jgi:hypothetical protein